MAPNNLKQSPFLSEHPKGKLSVDTSLHGTLFSTSGLISNTRKEKTIVFSYKLCDPGVLYMTCG